MGPTCVSYNNTLIMIKLVFQILKKTTLLMLALIAVLCIECHDCTVSKLQTNKSYRLWSKCTSKYNTMQNEGRSVVWNAFRNQSVFQYRNPCLIIFQAVILEYLRAKFFTYQRSCWAQGTLLYKSDCTQMRSWKTVFSPNTIRNVKM